jgi:C-terminal processing protease CtpA/Prc
LQLGDVIIRLNGEDVSTLEGEFVSELLMRFEGRSIRVTYLRKTMLV